MVRESTRIDKNRISIHMQNKTKRIGMTMSRNTQETKRGSIKVKIRFAKSRNSDPFCTLKNKMAAFRIKAIVIHQKSGSDRRHPHKLLAPRPAEQQFVLVVPHHIGTLERRIVKINSERNKQRLEIIEMSSFIRAQHKAIVTIAVHRIIAFAIQHGVHVACHRMEPTIIRIRKRNTRTTPHHGSNQEKIIDKLDILRRLFAIYTLRGILQKNFSFEPRLGILQASLAVRDVPAASGNEKPRIFRNQMVVRRRIQRRMVIRILRMLKNQRKPDVVNKFFYAIIHLEQLVNIQDLPAKVQTDKPQIDFDIAVPVDTHHIRVRIFPARQMIAEQFQVLFIAAFFIKQGDMQQELQAVHLPHMFRTAIPIATDINFMGKRHWKRLPRRNIQMPVNRFKNIHRLFKNRIMQMRRGIFNHRGPRQIQLRSRRIDLAFIKNMRTHPLANTVKEFAHRKSF